MTKKIAHINVFGEVWAGGVSLSQIKTEINNAADAEEIHVHIHSPGGEVIEGFAIYDALKASGKKVNTYVEGLSGSIASVIMMAGTERHATPNSQIFIHNPWGMTGGDAEQVQKYADDLKMWEQKIVDIYASVSGKTADDFKPLMDKETFISADDAKALNLITIIDEVKIAAYMKPKPINSNTNPTTEAMSKILNDFKNLFTQFKNKLAEGNEPKNLTLTDKSGTIFMTDSDEALAVGQTITKEDGSPALTDGGEIVLADDTKITIDKDGKVTAVIPAQAEDNVENLKAKVAKLETELAEAKKIENEIKTMETELRAMVSTYKPKAAITQFRRTEKEEENRVKLAKERRANYPVNAQKK